MGLTMEENREHSDMFHRKRRENQVELFGKAPLRIGLRISRVQTSVTVFASQIKRRRFRVKPSVPNASPEIRNI